MTYQLPKLPFSYDALEPFIDAETMQIHHSKHHQGYVNKFNSAIQGTKFEDTPLDAILSSDSALPAAIRDNGGGHYNHTLFWNILSPEGGGNPPTGGELAEAIENSFFSFDSFKETFAEIAASRFGSGWVWLIVTRDNNKLAITSTPNQDNPLMNQADIQGVPILGLDVWEHAYYLNYQNRRANYIDAFWNIVNWVTVEANYNRAKESTWEKILRYTSTAIASPGIL